MGETSAPRTHLIIEPLASYHDRAAFSCGVADMDAYLHDMAPRHEKREVSRVFVLAPTPHSPEVMGYYTLSNYAILAQDLPKSMARGLPTRLPLPATLLGQIAIDRRYQAQRLGSKLLLHALREALRATYRLASLGVVVDARTPDLVEFYKKRGFVEMLDREQHLIVPITRIRTMFPDEAEGLPLIEDMLRESEAAAAILEELDSALLDIRGGPVDEHTRSLLHDLQRHIEAMTGRKPPEAP